MEWNKTSERVPDEDPNSTASTPCVVWRNGSIGVLCFNHEYQCWDDESGDDYECDINAVDYWMIPVYPV